MPRLTLSAPNRRSLAATLGLLALIATIPAVAQPEPSVERTRTEIWLDPDGRPLPFTSHDEVLEFLSTAEVVSTESIPTGVTNPIKALLEKDGVRAHAVFRSFHKEQKNVLGSSGQVIRYFLDSYVNELAAYDLSRYLGLDTVPPVVRRTIRREKGSLQLWLEGMMTEEERLKKGLEPPDAERWSRQMQVMAVFDNLINNIDRNRGNILIDEDWDLWLIDHTRAFSRSWNLPSKAQLEVCERGLFEALVSTDEKAVRARLKPYLGSIEITAMFKRRQQIVELLQKRIDEVGEGKVLYTLN